MLKRIIVSVCAIATGLVFCFYAYSQEGNSLFSYLQFSFPSSFSYSKVLDEADTSDHTYTFSDSIQSLSVTTYGEVVIQSGTEWKIETQGFSKAGSQEDDPVCLTCKNGKLELTTDESERNLQVSQDAQILITVPEKADSIEIDASTGSVSISDLQINTLSIDAQMGEVTLTNVQIGTADVSLDMGSFSMQGSILETLIADCSMGSCSLLLPGSSEDYAFDLSAELGSVKVTGMQSTKDFLSDFLQSGSSSLPLIQAECDMGSITVRFSD